MKLNHINLTVPDVITTADFFVKNFDFTCTEIKGNNMLAVLYDVDGFVLVLTSFAFNKKGNNTYPDAFHVGFLVKTKEEVNNKYNELTAAGITIEHAPRNLHGAFGFYFNAPGNILVEVSAYVD